MRALNFAPPGAHFRAHFLAAISWPLQVTTMGFHDHPQDLQKHWDRIDHCGLAVVLANVLHRREHARGPSMK